MPGKVKVKIISGKNLPIMDRSNDTTDAYVEIKLGNITYKTEVCRRTLHPRWNTDWYRFELDDSELQDEPLQIRLMDHDTYSANDAIGKVYLNLNPLLLPAAGQLALGDNNPQHEISGWIPVYDTMHGIRGEVNVTVKVELFSDFNKFRQSSCGIKFFYSQCIPQGYQVRVINGFVEELIVDDDPEYQWIDKIRTPRASNEARQTLFFKLSGELQRKIGVKAINLGGNAVIGYKQCFDLEGESGIVARGIGTSVTLVKAVFLPNSLTEFREEDAEKYLKFVGDGKCFSLGLPVHSSFRLNLPTPLRVPSPLTKRISKKLSQRLYSSLDSGNISSISSPSVFQDDTALKVLLSQEDKRGKSAFSKRFQKFKHSQKSLTKKMTALRVKLGDSIGEGTEHGIIGKRSNFKRATSDSGAMAEFLARSVIQATSSLSCILESRAPPKVEETMESLQPLSSLLSKTESQSVVQDNPSDGSDSSSETTSSDSEYDESEINLNDVETISNIVSNVEKLQQRNLIKANLKKQHSLPSISLRGYSAESLDTILETDYKLTQQEKRTKESLSEIKEDDSSSAKQDISKFKESDKKIPNIEGNWKKKAVLIETSFGCHNDNDYASANLEKHLDKAYNVSNIQDNMYSSRKSYFSKCPRDHTNFCSIDLTSPDDYLSKSAKTEDIKTPDSSIIVPIKNVGLKESKSAKSNSLIKTSKFKICEYPETKKKILEPEIRDLKENKNAEENITQCVSSNDSYKNLLALENSEVLSESADYVPVSDKVYAVLDIKNQDASNVKSTTVDLLVSSKTNEMCEKIIENSAIFMKTNEGIEKAVVPEKLVKQICEKAIENSPIISKTIDESKKINEIIAPVDIESLHAESNQLVKTAMQLILLDKLNTMGASTPPASPVVLNDSKKFHLPESLVTKQGEDLNNLNLLSETKTPKQSMPKSLSSLNFGPYLKQDDFDFNDQSDTLSCFSDTDVHEPSSVKQVLKKKRKFQFFKLKFNKEHDHFLPQKADRESPQSGVPHQNILSKMFHVEREEKTLKNTETQTSTEFLNYTYPPALFTSSNANDISNIQPPYPGNTDNQPGLSHILSITNPACITSNRQNASPVHQESSASATSEQKKNASPERTPGKHSYSPIKLNASALLHRRSSDSDLSITPKGNSLTGSDRSGGHTASMHMKNHYVRRNGPQDNFEMMEYPFLTMNSFPSSFVMHIGSSVSSKSVKVLERISNIDEPESRDSWWSEIRTEIRAHARSLNCNAVLGYTESASIYEDVCVLSASGTAAVVDFNNLGFGIEDDNATTQRNSDKDGARKTIYESPEHKANQNTFCRISHLPYDDQNVSASGKMLKCPICSKGRVPEVLMVTIEPLDNLPNVGKGCFIECHVSRSLKDGRGESIAREISDGLPFLEYELHRLLVNKLKIKGMNAIFSLKIRYSMGEKMLMAIASGTAIYLSSLHAPTLPVLVSDRVADEKIVAGLQEMLIETIKKNREIYEIKDDTYNKLDDEAEDGKASLDLAFGNKDCSILEMDDPEDAEVVSLLMEDKVPDGFHVVNTESVPGLDDLEIVKNLQMFIQIYRAKISPNHNLQKHFHRLLQSVYFKLRRMVPCALCDLQFRVDIPDADEIQLCIIGMALGLGKKDVKRTPMAAKKSEDDLIFKLDEDTPQDTPIHGLRSNLTSLKYKPVRSPSKHRNQSLKQRHIPHKERHGVDITPLSYVPGGNIEQYLGNLNFFFIRETTSIREEGGLSGLIHSFITEVLAIVRSHVSALGGNALVAFFMTECFLNHNLHKNQGQCLINVGGDVVSVSYQDEA